MFEKKAEKTLKAENELTIKGYESVSRKKSYEHTIRIPHKETSETGRNYTISYVFEKTSKQKESYKFY